MSLLSVVNDVCAAVGVRLPSTIFGNITNDRTMQEMLALANEMAQRMATDTRDWTVLRKDVMFPGDGVAEAFDLPPDYRRILTHGNVWSSNYTSRPLRFIADTDAWLQRAALGYADGAGEWTIYGGQMHVRPVMAVGASVRFPYLSKNCIEMRDTNNLVTGLADLFQSDRDAYRLPERLLKLGMIWQWKALKGSPYAEDMGTWSDAIALAMGADSPSPTLIDRLPASAWDPIMPWIG